MPLETIPIFDMEIYRAGESALYKGRSYTIDHVTVAGYELLVYLIGVGPFGETQSVNSNLVRVTPTVVNFNRNIT